MTLQRFLLLCGVFGTPIFLLALFLTGLMYPGYDHFNQTISELGAIDSPVKTFANIFVFELFGILTILFSVGVFKSKETHTAGKIGALFFAAAGVVVFLVGIFYGDAYETLFTPRAILHSRMAFYPFPIMTVGFLFFAFDIIQNKKLRWLVIPIIIVGPIGLALRYLSAQFPYPYFLGVLQRTAIALPFLILAVIAMALYRIETRKNNLLLFAASVAIAAIGVAGMYANGDASSVKTGIPYLCSTEEACRDYCYNRVGRCQTACDVYPANSVCKKLFGSR